MSGRASHKFHRRVNSKKRRKRKKELFARDGPLCHYGCGTILTHETATVDHKIPGALGGSAGMDNSVISCDPCNNEKADTPYEEFMAKRGLTPT